MKPLKITCGIALSAALLLSGTACRTTAEQHRSPAEITTKSNAAPTVAEQDPLPLMYIHYRDAGAVCAAQLTPSESFAWTATMSDGTRATVEQVGKRPYDQENLCTVWSADTEGEVRLALHMLYPYPTLAIEGAEFYAAEDLPALTVTAYPIGEDGTVDFSAPNSRTVDAANGRFSMLVGHFYHELKAQMTHGYATYGFIGHRIDAAEYQVTTHVSGCLVSYQYEDPDYDDKVRPTVHLWKTESNGGKELWPIGENRWDYTNEANTPIQWTYAGPKPWEYPNIATFYKDDLPLTVEIVFATKYPTKSYSLVRYRGGDYENAEYIPITDGRFSITDSGYYYLMEVHYENGGVVQYGFYTAEITLEEARRYPIMTAAQGIKQEASS